MKNRLIEILKEKGKSQGWLAYECRMNVTEINKIIRKETNIGIETAFKIAKALNLSIEEIWTEEE